MPGLLLAFIMLAVSSCATPPHSTRDACAIFEQRGGLINNWRRDTKKAQSRYGVPAHILLATIYVESGFRSNARPPRTKLLGFIPWKRPSTAYGYSQALDGTWDRYKAETGHYLARRNNFGDAVDFIGWYHRKSARQAGVSLHDSYNLYLVYHSGVAGYKKGAWRSRPAATQGARRFRSIANQYQGQLRSCL